MIEGKYRPDSLDILGKRLKKKQIEQIIETVELFPKNSCRELAKTICENLNWGTSSGTSREQFCLLILEKFDEIGLVKLPAKRSTSDSRKPIQHTSASDPGPPIALEAAFGGSELKTWIELVDRYHPRGYKCPIGRHLAYFVVGGSGQWLACLMFETSGALACRDEWVGWTQRQRDRRLELVVRNSRFLILPWVRVRNLASRALSMATSRSASDWETRWKVAPVLAKTFVDLEENDGACYKAANWSKVGISSRGKDVNFYELVPDSRIILKRGRKKPKGSRRGKRTKRNRSDGWKRSRPP